VLKIKKLLTLLAVVCATSIVAQAPPSYTAVEAAKHVGQTAVVTDKVASVHQSPRGQIFLYMGGANPNQAFTASIPAASAAQFSRVQTYKGQMVAVSGKIVLFGGKPGIVVNSPSQISVLR